MAELIKTIALLLLLSAAAFSAWRCFASVSQTIQQRNTWRRISVMVTGQAEDNLVEVTLPKKNPEDVLEEEIRYKVAVDNPFFYRNWTSVDLLENPANPTEKKLDFFPDIWANSLAAGLALLFSALLLWQVATIKAGAAEAWSTNGWELTQASFDSNLLPLAQLREPASFWKTNLAVSLLMGGLLASAALFGNSYYPAIRVLFGVAAIGLFGLLAWGAAESYTLRLVVDKDGITEKSLWGTKRLLWHDVARLHIDSRGRLLQDQITQADMSVARRKSHREYINQLTRFRAFYINLLDKQNHPILRIATEVEPAEEREKFLRLVRSKFRDSAADADDNASQYAPSPKP